MHSAAPVLFCQLELFFLPFFLGILPHFSAGRLHLSAFTIPDSAPVLDFLPLSAVLFCPPAFHSFETFLCLGCLSYIRDPYFGRCGQMQALFFFTTLSQWLIGLHSRPSCQLTTMISGRSKNPCQVSVVHLVDYLSRGTPTSTRWASAS